MRKEAFPTTYARVFARHPPVQAVKITNIPVSGQGRSAGSHPEPEMGSAVGGKAAAIRRMLRFGTSEVSTPILQRLKLVPNTTIQGSLLVEKSMSTLIVLPDA